MKTIKKITPTEDIYQDMFFYKLLLENPNLMLTQDVLVKHRPPSAGKNKEIKKCRNSFISFNTGILGIALKSGDNTSSKVYVGIEDNAISVGCQCGMPEKALCDHAYQVLSNLVDKKSYDFRPYYWPGFDNDEAKTNKFLDVKISGSNIRISPKDNFGDLYIKNLGFKYEKLTLNDPSRSKIAIRKQGSKIIVGYHFLYNADQSNRSHLPFILPFVGISNKISTDILTIERYLKNESDTVQDYEFTSDQIKLNKICYQMFNLAKTTSGIEHQGLYPKELTEAMVKMLELWRIAVPILKKEPYVRGSYSWDIKRVGAKPRMKDALEIKVNSGTLKIDFLLKEHDDHYTLEPLVSAYYKDITNDFWKFPLFIVDPIRGSYYHFHLIDDLQDDTTLEWFSRSRRILTVLKEDYDEFRESTLSKLDDHYIIYFIAFRARKKIRWNKQIPVNPGYYQQLNDDWHLPPNEKRKY